MAGPADRTAEAETTSFDIELAARAAGGDQAARTTLVDRSRRRVHGWCCGILRDPEGAEDATQDALLQLWRHIGALRDPRAFPAWLYRTTLNACRRQHLREEAVGIPGHIAPDDSLSRLSDVSAPTPEEIAVARAELEQLLCRLRDPDRAILSMKYEQDLSAREIGRALNISEGAARTRLHAVIARLRRLVGIRKPPRP